MSPIQNIYDNPEFYEEYAKLRNNKQGFNNLIEQAAIRSVLPKLNGRSIIDLGCGFGLFCQYAASAGAQSIYGIDPSKKMLAVAQENTLGGKIQYICSSIEDFNTGIGSVDLVVSSLALHYVEDYQAAVKKIFSWIKPGGEFIFSVEHPICTANPQMLTAETNSQIACFPIINYRDEGVFSQTWFVENVRKYHRTIETYLNVLLEVGFSLKKLLEPMPSDKMIAENPPFAVHKIRPPLLLICATK